MAQLARLGCSAKVASDGFKVLDAMATETFDPLLVDCQMPRMDGYEVAGRIRKMEAASGCKSGRTYIVAVTAHAMLGDREKCIQSGMDDYLVKPVRQPELEAALERCAAQCLAPPEAESMGAASNNSSNSKGGFVKVAPEVQTVNFESLREVADEPAVRKELIGVYLNDSEVLYSELKAAIQKQECSKIASLAHKWWGSSAACGIEALLPSLRQIEEMGLEGSPAKAEPLVSQVREILDRVTVCLNEYVGRE